MIEDEKAGASVYPDQEQVERAAENFSSRSEPITGVEKYGRGIIHDTYLVRCGGRAESFILQRINTKVFQRPELIMQNLHVLSEHVQEQQKYAGPAIDAGWKMVRIIPTRAGGSFFIDPAGGFWRALSFISNAYPLEEIISPDNAGEAGRALGIFHHLTSGLKPGLLHDTLPGFHNVGFYLDYYDQVISAETDTAHSGLERYCREFIAARRQWAPVLENGRHWNRLQLQVIHGDPKCNNILLDKKTNRAVSIIDLDTVKPGLLLYDIGDCLRSCCSIHSNEPDDPDAVRFDLERCRAVLAGYMEAAPGRLTQQDFVYLYDAVRLLPFELGLRFYTDYLDGNIYFKSSYEAQNLHRTIKQFRLVESIERQEESIRSLIEKWRSA